MIRPILTALVLCAAVAGAVPAALAPGEGYIALVYDSLEPLEAVKFNVNGKLKLVTLGGEYDSGKHLVVQALEAGRYCLESYVAAGTKWTLHDRTANCFDVRAGEVAYGGHYMPRSFNTPNGALNRTLRVSDPADMIARIEKEAPAIWAAHRGAPERYAVDEAFNRVQLRFLGEGLIENRSYKQGNDFLKLASRLGDASAMMRLGYAHFLGRGVDRDYAKAADWWRQGAAAGNERAAAMLCMALDLGYGVAEDPVAAAGYCSTAAEGDDEIGLWYLGSMLRRGRGVAADPKRGAELEQRAEALEPFAERMFDFFELRKPDKSYPDPEGAYRLAKLAVDRKVGGARFRLAHYALRGIGTAPDARRAEQLFIESAEKDGRPRGYYRVAQMYCMADGVARDIPRCHDLLDKYAKESPAVGANEAAWFLATVDVAEARDGKRAVGLAKRALAQNDSPNPDYLDTLACAYAELGRWDEAIKTQRKAIAILHKRGVDEAALKPFEEKIDEFLRKEPHRELFE